MPLTLESPHRRGPSSGLAYFVSTYAFWFQDRRDEVVGTAASFLRSNDDAVAEAAVQMLIFARGFDWPADATALREADHAVEAAAPSLMTRSDGVVRALGSYPATRDLLWEEIERNPAERASALLALTQIGDLRDLPRIGDLLLQPGEKDPRGTELAGLVYHLINTYGEVAIPYIQRALAESPYVWVRTQSAEQLALKGRVEAFRFFLDAITANRSYRSELENWLRVTFRLPANNAPNRVDERNGEPALLAFLNERIRDPKPPSEDSPSADSARSCAAASRVHDQRLGLSVRGCHFLFV